MNKRNPLNLQTLQKIKTEEFQRFFSDKPEYSPYINHLGEVHWMKAQEALDQHEFFVYDETLFQKVRNRIKQKYKLNLTKMPLAEREFRLQCRVYLDKNYLGNIQSGTKKYLPKEWNYKFTDEEIEHIPTSFDFGIGGLWKKALFTLGLIIILSLIGYFLLNQKKSALSGKLIVHADLIGARIYLDRTNFLGYSGKIIEDVPLGNHRVFAIKEGYTADPMYHEVEIFPDSLCLLNFSFKVTRTEKQGFLKVIAEQSKSKIYIDNQFLGLVGETPVLNLSEGQYSVSIIRDGFLTVPKEKIVTISPGDTSILIVHQVPVTQTQTTTEVVAPGTAVGSIEVTSNIKDANIILNGKDSGFKTDYVFTQMKYGKYIVTLEKEGFVIIPRRMELFVNENNSRVSVNFQLSKTYETVIIKTTPEGGAIFIDGNFMGEGRVETVIELGNHQVSFGEIKGFKKPSTRNIEVKAGFPLDLNIVYFPKLKILAEVSSNGNIFTSNCELLNGYTYSSQAFTTSEEGGATVEFNERLNDYLWKLGYAFAYRNPKGNDALKLLFNLPRNLDYEQNFTIRVLGAPSKEKYSSSISNRVDVSMKFNNIKLLYNEPKYLEDLGGLELFEFDITQGIKSGENSFEITLSDENNNYFYIKRIEIYN